jgi:hypothetical protein
MRAFDRAMVAMFLLVLLADVARAGAVGPADTTGGVIRTAATQVRVSPEDGSFEVILARGNGRIGAIRFASQDRVLANEFLSTYRAALRRSTLAKSRLTSAGPMRSLFDELCVESGSTVASLGGEDASSPFDSRMTAELIAQPVMEHTGSPAP